MFFFEKKNQKTFDCCRGAWAEARHTTEPGSAICDVPAEREK
jgi:hypothetical protein